MASVRLVSVLVLVLVLTALAGCGGSSMGGSMGGSINAPSSLAGTVMGSSFHLTWKDNSEMEEEFVIERKAGSGAFAEFARVPFNTTQFMVDSRDPGTMYGFRVVAVMGETKSAPSNDVMWMP